MIPALLSAVFVMYLYNGLNPTGGRKDVRDTKSRGEITEEAILSRIDAIDRKLNEAINSNRGNA
jgi:hypothetical protein